MITCLDIIRSSLRLIGQLGPGQGPSAAQMVDAVWIFNSMLDQWNTERLNIFTISIALYPTLTNTQIRTIGPGGNWDTDRPIRIVRANVLLSTSPTVRRAMYLLSDAEWAAKAVQAVYTIPMELYNDGSSPVSSLYFYPIPDNAYQIELYTWQQLVQVFDETVPFDFPAGYADALRYNLAVRLAPEWGKALRTDVVELARTTKAAIQSLNSVTPRLKSEPGLASRRGTGFNWFDRSST